MEYIEEQITSLGGYLSSTFGVLGDKGAIVLLIASAIIIVLAIKPWDKK